MTTATTKNTSKTEAQHRGAYEALTSEFGYTNRMQGPKIQKVVVTVGVGSSRDKDRHKIVTDRLTRITGQKSSARGAKKSIATFKTRQGDVVGYQVTLRGERMYDFLEKLIHIALPRTRDFQGISAKAIDEMGNLTIGIREHTIFPETSDEDVKDVFGLGITINTTAKNKKEAEAYLRHIGIPFKKA